MPRPGLPLVPTLACLAVLAGAGAAAAAPKVGLALQPAVGLSDDEAAQAQKRIVDELSELGLTVIDAPAVDPGCVPDAGCVENARLAMLDQTAGLLVVELVRIGPVVQLTATGAAGEARAGGSHGLEADKLMGNGGGGTALPQDIVDWARALVPTEPVIEDPPPPPPPPPPPTELTPMQNISLFLGGAGIVVTVASGIVVMVSETTLNDPDSAGQEKESARVAGVAGVVGLVVGLAAAAGGTALYLME